jgi:hypothetical protein
MQTLFSSNPLLVLGILVAILTATALMLLGAAMLSVFIAGFTDHHDSPNEGMLPDDIDIKQ